MTKTASKIRFKAKLFRPANEKVGSWMFLTVPKNASAKLPLRGMTAIEGTIPFQATLEPDGQKSHWLEVDRKRREAADGDAGDVVTLEIAWAKRNRNSPCRQICERLSRAPLRRRGALWSDVTPIARRDWFHWITSAKQHETCARRIKNACSMPGSDGLLLRPLRVLQ